MLRWEAQIHWATPRRECSEIHGILGCFSNQQILALEPSKCSLEFDSRRSCTVANRAEETSTPKID